MSFPIVQNLGKAITTVHLPAAGYGYGSGLGRAGSGGLYWSSSLYTGSPNYAYYLYFDDGSAGTYSNGRYFGRSVRALSE